MVNRPLQQVIHCSEVHQCLGALLLPTLLLYRCHLFGLSFLPEKVLDGALGLSLSLKRHQQLVSLLNAVVDQVLLSVCLAFNFIHIRSLLLASPLFPLNKLCTLFFGLFLL